MSLPPNYTGSESLLAGGQGAAPPITAMRGGGIRWANNSGKSLEAVRYFKSTEPAEAFENNEAEYISLDNVIGPLPEGIRDRLKRSMRKYIMDIQGEYFVHKINREAADELNANDEDVLESFVDVYNDIKDEEEGETVNPISGNDENIRTLKPKLERSIMEMLKLQIGTLKKHGAAPMTELHMTGGNTDDYIGPLAEEIVNATKLSARKLITQIDNEYFIPKLNRDKARESNIIAEDTLDGMVSVYNDIKGKRLGKHISPITGDEQNIPVLKINLKREIINKINEHANALKVIGSIKKKAAAPPIPTEPATPPNAAELPAPNESATPPNAAELPAPNESATPPNAAELPAPNESATPPNAAELPAPNESETPPNAAELPAPNESETPLFNEREAVKEIDTLFGLIVRFLYVLQDTSDINQIDNQYSPILAQIMKVNELLEGVDIPASFRKMNDAYVSIASQLDAIVADKKASKDITAGLQAIEPKLNEFGFYVNKSDEEDGLFAELMKAKNLVNYYNMVPEAKNDINTLKVIVADVEKIINSVESATRGIKRSGELELLLSNIKSDFTKMKETLAATTVRVPNANQVPQPNFLPNAPNASQVPQPNFPPTPENAADEYSNAAIRGRLAAETKAKFAQALNIYGDKFDLNSSIEYQYSHKPLKRFLADYGIGPDYQEHTDAIIRAFFTVFPNPSSGEAVGPAAEVHKLPEFHVICAFLQYRILTLRFEIQLTMRSTERRTALEHIVKKLQNLLKGGKCGSINTALAIETMASKEQYEKAAADAKTAPGAKLATMDGKLDKILADLTACCEKLSESLKPGGTFSAGMVGDIQKIINGLKAATGTPAPAPAP